MYCTNCGAPMPEQDRFCRYCGAPQTGTASPVPPAPVASPGPAPMPMGCPPVAGYPAQPGQIPPQPWAYPPPWVLPPLPPAPHIGWEPEPVPGVPGSRIVPILCMVCLAGAGLALFFLL